MGPPDGGGDLIDHQGCGHALHNPTQGGGGALQGPLLDGGEGRHSVTEAVGGHALKSVPLVVKGDALDGEGRGHGAEGVPEEGGPALHSSLPVQGVGEDGVRYTAFLRFTFVLFRDCFRQMPKGRSTTRPCSRSTTPRVTTGCVLMSGLRWWVFTRRWWIE